MTLRASPHLSRLVTYFITFIPHEWRHIKLSIKLPTFKNRNWVEIRYTRFEVSGIQKHVLQPKLSDWAEI